MKIQKLSSSTKFSYGKLSEASNSCDKQADNKSAQRHGTEVRRRANHLQSQAVS